MSHPRFMAACCRASCSMRCAGADCCGAGPGLPASALPIIFRRVCVVFSGCSERCLESGRSAGMRKRRAALRGATRACHRATRACMERQEHCLMRVVPGPARADTCGFACASFGTRMSARTEKRVPLVRAPPPSFSPSSGVLFLCASRSHGVLEEQPHRRPPAERRGEGRLLLEPVADPRRRALHRGGPGHGHGAVDRRAGGARHRRPRRLCRRRALLRVRDRPGMARNGAVRPHLRGFGPNLPPFGLGLAWRPRSTEAGTILIEFSQHWLRSAKFGPRSTSFGADSTELGRCWPGVGQHRGPTSANVGPMSTVGHARSSCSSQRWPEP